MGEQLRQTVVIGVGPAGGLSIATFVLATVALAVVWLRRSGHSVRLSAAATDPAQGSLAVKAESRPTPGGEAEVCKPEVCKPETVVIELFGPLRLRNSSWELTPQQLAFVTFLACVGEADKQTIIDALWNGKVVSKSRFPNLLAEVRAKIGRDHLPESVDGRYRLVGVTTDVALLEQAIVDREHGSGDGQDVETILAGIHGVPFSAPSNRHWAWVSARTDMANRAEVLAVSAALALCAASCRDEDLESARRVCEYGLVAAPLDETLIMALTDVLLQQGRRSSAKRLVENWERQIRDLECGEPSRVVRDRLSGAGLPRR